MSVLIKQCYKCKKEKLKIEFNKDSGKIDGLHSYCRECHRNSSKTEDRKLKLKLSSRAYRERTEFEYLDYFSNRKCLDCGETNPIVLDWDHVGDKTFTISAFRRKSRILSPVIKESEKCVVRCGNCHRIKTLKEVNSLKYKYILHGDCVFGGRRRNYAREYLIKYLKDKICIDCQNSNLLVLEFDHVRGKKEYHVGKLAAKNNLAKLILELQKCDIRCVNCHRIKTAIDGNFYAYRYLVSRKSLPAA